MRWLLIHAHPDDETLWTGVAAAHLLERGDEVHVLTMTLGEEGEVIPPDLRHLELPAGQPRAADAPDPLADVRRGELDGAMQALGVTSWAVLGDEPGEPRVRDSGMVGTPSAEHPRAFVGAPPEQLAPAVAERVRRLAPDAVLTYDRTGGYGHPDHVRTHEVTLAALRLLDDPPALYARVTPESWWQQDLAGVGDLLTPERRDAWRVGAPADDHTARLSVVPDEQVTHVVADAAAVPRQVAALTQHRTQVRLLGEPAQAYALSNDIALLLTGREAYQQLDVATGEPLAAGGDPRPLGGQA